MWSYFSSSACGNMPNTQNMPYRAHSGCLGGGRSEGGALIQKEQRCVMVGKWRLSSCKCEGGGVVRELTGHDKGDSTLLVTLNKAGHDEEGYYPPCHHVSFWHVKLM